MIILTLFENFEGETSSLNSWNLCMIFTNQHKWVGWYRKPLSYKFSRLNRSREVVKPVFKMQFPYKLGSFCGNGNLVSKYWKYTLRLRRFSSWAMLTVYILHLLATLSDFCWFFNLARIFCFFLIIFVFENEKCFFKTETLVSCFTLTIS